MNEKIVKFRTSVVGGFDRHDVIDYIKQLSEERNMLYIQLAGYIAQDNASIANWQALDNQKLLNAENLLSALETKHEEIGKQIRNLREHLESTRS